MNANRASKELVGVGDQMKMAREHALLGNYEASLVYFDGVVSQINLFLRTVDDAYTKAQWQKAKDDLVARIDDLTNTVNILRNELKNLEHAIAEMRLLMKPAGEGRELENTASQEAVADQCATQQPLGNALSIQQGFYDAVLVQRRGTMDAAKQMVPGLPPGFRS